MSSLRYFSLHNINLESSFSFLRPDNTTGNEHNGLPTFFCLPSDSSASCVVILGLCVPLWALLDLFSSLLGQIFKYKTCLCWFSLGLCAMEMGSWQLWFTKSHFLCTGFKAIYVFGICGSKNACVLHNWSHLKATGGGCARPAACPVCEEAQAPPAHSHAGHGTHCPSFM